MASLQASTEQEHTRRMDSVSSMQVNRWFPAAPFALVATVAVIAGGLIAAIVAHDPSRYAVWAVAYLVLVVGVIQFALAAGQALLATERLSTPFLTTECVLLNVGNVGVIVGTLLGFGIVVDAGGVLLIIALTMFLYGIRGTRERWLRYVYCALLLFVLLSIATGLGLSAERLLLT